MERAAGAAAEVSSRKNRSSPASPAPSRAGRSRKKTASPMLNKDKRRSRLKAGVVPARDDAASNASEGAGIALPSGSSFQPGPNGFV